MALLGRHENCPSLWPYFCITNFITNSPMVAGPTLTFIAPVLITQLSSSEVNTSVAIVVAQAWCQRATLAFNRIWHVTGPTQNEEGCQNCWNRWTWGKLHFEGINGNLPFGGSGEYPWDFLTRATKVSNRHDQHRHGLSQCQGAARLSPPCLKISKNPSANIWKKKEPHYLNMSTPCRTQLESPALGNSPQKMLLSPSPLAECWVSPSLGSLCPAVNHQSTLPIPATVVLAGGVMSQAVPGGFAAAVVDIFS